jgi:hypothetical protein
MSALYIENISKENLLWEGTHKKDIFTIKLANASNKLRMNTLNRHKRSRSERFKEASAPNFNWFLNAQMPRMSLIPLNVSKDVRLHDTVYRDRMSEVVENLRWAKVCGVSVHTTNLSTPRCLYE